ncbi:MAG: formate/nitrite transporter family protein [Bacilli bacterium]|nr:formate/nitrite transporter family protein [Bacilli bacterium]
MLKLLRKIQFKVYFDYLLKGIYAGIMIAIGAVAYLAIPNKVVGAFIFSVGLLTVCMYGMNLYTGKIGYILINKLNYIWELLFTLIGNFIGTFIVGNLIRYTRFFNYVESARNLVSIKLNDIYFSNLLWNYDVYCC